MTHTTPTPADHTAPYTFPHKSRAGMVAYILDNGGRFDSYGRTFHLLTYNVKTWSANVQDFDTLRAAYTAAHLTPAEVDAARVVHARLMQGTRDHLTEWALESMWEQLQDADTYTADYDGTPHAIKWVQLGRSGGYIAPESFDGRPLKFHSRADAADALSDHEQWTNKDVRHLYRMARMWAADFTQDAAARELEYQAASRLFEDIAADAMTQARNIPRDHAAPVLVLTGDAHGGRYEVTHGRAELTPEEIATHTPEELSAIVQGRAVQDVRDRFTGQGRTFYALHPDRYEITPQGVTG